MRTTLTLDDDIFRLARRYARGRSVALGRAVSELVRRGFTVRRPTRTVHGLQVFDLPKDSPRVTRQTVEDLEAEE